MALVNENFLKLKAGYLFPEIGRRVKAFVDAEPVKAKSLIRCGIGDVTEPLPDAAREAMKLAVDELGARETFRGYGPEQGYEFLRKAIADNAYAGVEVSADEVFVSDGSKCDTGNILDIFGKGIRVAITDPVYPVYVDTNVMAGNTGEGDESGRFEGLVYLPCTAENNFVPALPEEKVDLIYLCYPNNPTGTVATREELEKHTAGEPARQELEAEVGDLLFVVVNLARKLGIDPEVALEGTNVKFTDRFGSVESGLKEAGQSLEQADLGEMERRWQLAKERGRMG